MQAIHCITLQSRQCSVNRFSTASPSLSRGNSSCSWESCIASITPAASKGLQIRGFTSAGMRQLRLGCDAALDRHYWSRQLTHFLSQMRPHSSEAKLLDLNVQMTGHAPNRGGTGMHRDRVQCFVHQPLHLLKVLLHSSCDRCLLTQHSYTLIRRPTCS